MANNKWPTLPLGEITENYDSIRVPVKESDRKPGPYPYYGASGIVDRVDGYLFDGEYLLIAEDGENLRTRQTPVAFLATGKFWVNNHAHIVCGNKQANTKYIMYSLAQAEISGYLTGSTMPKLTQGNMNRIPMVTPPRHIQDRIVAILGTLDGKIELNRRTNETLEAMAKALFKSWFVDFDPVREKATGRRPASLDSATAKLFPAAFEDSRLGPIPKGWDTEELGNLTDINSTSIKKQFPHTEIEYVDISSVTVGRLDGTTTFSVQDAPSRAKRLVRHGDTIWSCVRPNHRSYLFISQPIENLVVSTGFAVLRPSKIGPAYLHAWTTTNEFVEYLTANADGSAYPAVRPEHFSRAVMLQPPEEVLSKFEAFCEPIHARIASNQEESRTLVSTRDSLLPKLLSGELQM